MPSLVSQRTQTEKGNDSLGLIFEQKTIVSVYIANRPDYENKTRAIKLVGSQILVGDDASHENASYCASPTDSGTWECASPLTGRNVFLY